MANKLWEKEYGGGLYEYSGQIVLNKRKEFFLCGVTQSFGANIGNTNDILVIKTDSLGNVKWQKNYGGIYTDVGSSCIATKDGGFVIAGAYTYQEPQPGIIYCKPWLIKLDSMGNTVWGKKYGDAKQNFLHKVIELEDGSIVAAGQGYNDSWELKGLFLKVAPNGDSLIYRYVDNLKGSSSSNYLYNIEKTNDNGFVACGFVSPQSPDTGKADMWIIKLDSLGCDSAGCPPVTVGIPTAQKLQEAAPIFLFPNPFNEQITLQLPEAYLEHTTQVYVFNMQGQLVYEQTALQTQLQLNTSQWQPGTYLVKVATSNGQFQTKKIIKN